MEQHMKLQEVFRYVIQNPGESLHIAGAPCGGVTLTLRDQSGEVTETIARELLYCGREATFEELFDRLARQLHENGVNQASGTDSARHGPLFGSARSRN